MEIKSRTKNQSKTDQDIGNTALACKLKARSKGDILKFYLQLRCIYLTLVTSFLERFQKILTILWELF